MAQTGATSGLEFFSNLIKGATGRKRYKDELALRQQAEGRQQRLLELEEMLNPVKQANYGSQIAKRQFDIANYGKTTPAQDTTNRLKAIEMMLKDPSIGNLVQQVYPNMDLNTPEGFKGISNVPLLKQQMMGNQKTQQQAHEKNLEQLRSDLNIKEERTKADMAKSKKVLGYMLNNQKKPIQDKKIPKQAYQDIERANLIYKKNPESIAEMVNSLEAKYRGYYTKDQLFEAITGQSPKQGGDSVPKTTATNTVQTKTKFWQ